MGFQSLCFKGEDRVWATRPSLPFFLMLILLPRRTRMDSVCFFIDVACEDRLGTLLRILHIAMASVCLPLALPILGLVSGWRLCRGRNARGVQFSHPLMSCTPGDLHITPSLIRSLTVKIPHWTVWYRARGALFWLLISNRARQRVSTLSLSLSLSLSL